MQRYKENPPSYLLFARRLPAVRLACFHRLSFLLLSSR